VRSGGRDNTIRSTCDHAGGVTIATGIAFQFRTTRDGPLEILIGTFPEWPGPEEAVRARGLWRPSA
jgi:hypothetical protein